MTLKALLERAGESSWQRLLPMRTEPETRGEQDEQDQGMVFENGVVTGITYQKPGSRWAIVRVRFRDAVRWAKGELLPIHKGLLYQFGGWWEEDERWGWGMRVRSRREVIPSDENQLQDYLLALKIPALTDELSQKIVQRWGLRSLQILEEEPQLLVELGVDPKTAHRIHKNWKRRLPSRSLLAAPQVWGLTTQQAHTLFDFYGGRTLSLLRQDPYALLNRAGVGFSTADQIAERVGIKRLDPRRSRAALLAILEDAASSEGHTALPHHELLARARSRKLQLTPEAAEEALIALERDHVIRRCPTGALVGLSKLVHAEREIASRLLQLSSLKTTRQLIPPPGDLLPQQEAAARAAQQHRLLLLTGSPGTGKTYTLRTILHCGWEQPVLAAPTGKAANRLSELTGLPAYTLHRLLEFHPDREEATRGADRPIEADLLVVDEAAMLDVPLARALVRAIDYERTTLLLCGDADQLPPVGPGNLLRNLIESGAFPVVRLEQIVRQDQTSQIIPNAMRILRKEPIVVDNHTYKDFKYFPVDASTLLVEQQELLKTLTEIFQGLLKRNFSARDIQVITPMKKGPIPGAHELNKMLQQMLNPRRRKTPQLRHHQQTFRLHDRVLQLRNDYERGIFNGDTGVIVEVDTSARQLEVQFEDRVVHYDDSNLSQLELAYAISIHKSQGSEWPVVIIPLSLSHKQMLSRHLLYTGMTRAKKLVILVGCEKSIAYALHRHDDDERITTLPAWIESLRAPQDGSSES